MALASALVWKEHCIECAVPDCYAVCPLFVARADNKCARFVYGIYANTRFSGLFDFGADVHFRRWGKLEARLVGGADSPRRLRQFTRLDRATLSVLSPIASGLARVEPKRKLNGLYRVVSERAIARATRVRSGAARFDDFVIEVYNPNPGPVGLIVEVQQDHPVYRTSVLLAPGPNLHRIAYQELEGFLEGPGGRLLVYPENDAEVRLVFQWLDLVRYTSRSEAGIRESSSATRVSISILPDQATGTQQSAAQPPDPRGSGRPEPASKVKCVAWDLDNTLWSGVLVEDGPAALTLRPGVVELIKDFDARGILNTIVSKNDHELAWQKVTELGLSEYFVSPAINWGPKSANLKAIAEILNIDISTFVLIDDSAFERGEVASALPQVRVVAETEIGMLLRRPEFDVPVSAESAGRRLSYLAEDKRRAIAASSGDSYEDFLTSCEMKTVLFAPTSPDERERVLELLLRSNQLNLSTRRYTQSELEAVLADKSILSLGFRCSDKFGDYGIVGFLTISMAGTTPFLRDLVISCQIAKKKVENAIFKWLVTNLGTAGATNLEAGYIPTPRDHVLLDTLREVGFVLDTERDGIQTLNLAFDHEIPAGAIVEIDANRVKIPPPIAGPGNDRRAATP